MQDGYSKRFETLCKSWPNISQFLALLVICVLIWANSQAIIPNCLSLDSTLMRFVYLFVGAQIAGIFVTFIYLPDLLGMLFWGGIYANMGLSNFAGYEKLESFLRDVALINIMLLAGLGLEARALKKFLGIILRLSFIPIAVETLTIAVLAHYFLIMPWIWGFMLGLVVTAISPNVVVTVMLRLKRKKVGLNNGIHTLIYATTTFNDVAAIFIFGVLLTIVFSESSPATQLMEGSVGIVIGISFGVVYGVILAKFPSSKAKYSKTLRFVLVLLGATFSVVGSKFIGYPTAGTLGCVTIAFVVRYSMDRGKSNKEANNLSSRLGLLWRFIKPISFSLIGKELNLSILDPEIMTVGVLLIIAGCLMRIVGSYFSLIGSKLSRKERAYITVAGIPKATIQAALGPLALDIARSLNHEDTLELAGNILIVSVLAIILTAPIGAILMIQLAPLWLQQGKPENDKENTELAHVRSKINDESTVRHSLIP